MDILLNHIERGKGFPLILLHGNGEDCTYFEYQISYFYRKYRVIAIDTRGHGQSPRGVRPFRIYQFAEDLCDFMDYYSIPKAHILGFSDGGNIALSFALRYPERVEKLILNGANLFPAGVKPAVQIPVVAQYRMAALLADKSPQAKAKEEMLGLMVNDPDIKPEELAVLRMPVLVIAGTRDMIREQHTRLLHESIPDAKLVFIKGDHFIALKKYEAFNKVVEEFLEAADDS